MWKLVSVIFHSLPQCCGYQLWRKTQQRQKHWMEKGNRDRWGKMAIFLVLEVVPSCLLPCLLWAIVKWLASVLLMYMLISAIMSRSYKSLKNSAMSGLNTPLLMEKKVLLLIASILYSCVSDPTVKEVLQCHSYKLYLFIELKWWNPFGK